MTKAEFATGISAILLAAGSFCVEVAIDAYFVYMAIHSALVGKVFWSCLWGVSALYIVGEHIIERFSGGRDV